MSPCCSWEDFSEDFAQAYAGHFDAPPTKHAKSMAKRDWNAGNTGWEAAHNAMRRARARVVRNRESAERTSGAPKEREL